MGTLTLIISNPADEHTTQVVAKICAAGGDPVLFYPEELGHTAAIVLTHCLAPEATIPTLIVAGRAIDLRQVYSIWYRRPRLPAGDPDAMSPEGLEFARDEWQAALQAAYALAAGPLWVSHPDKLREAARKPLQLSLARSLGLCTPRTLITNDPARARQFYEQCQGQVIAKATGNGWVYSSQGNDDVYFVLTNRVQAGDLEAIAEIQAAPVTFQEEIPKAYEIRANVVGQQVLSVRIDSQRSEVSRLDWRRYDVGNTPYAPYTLPDRVNTQCRELTRSLGLEFGAIDLIRRPDGEYVFLEINGNGQFLWAEELSGVKISDALASLLAGNTPPLKSL